MPSSPTVVPSAEHHYQFVTGKLADRSVRQIVEGLATRHGFRFTVDVLPITVAALMTPKWLRRHLRKADGVTHVVLPGHVGQALLDEVDEGDQVRLESIIDIGAEVLVGPKDVRELPEWFGERDRPPDLRKHNIEIIAEINHAPRMSMDEFSISARQLHADGADRIDIGCDPSHPCNRIADYVTCALETGANVSIDTFDRHEAAAATEAGATLVLSVNSSNRDAAVHWNSEVVAIPDSPDDLPSLFRTVDHLERHEVRFRLDGILEPIGTGLFASLLRYQELRQRYPHAAMMMGIGNVTELTDVDSAGLNFLLLGICQELQIESVLTTQVINWARTSVRECDIARRLVRYAVEHGVPPKRLSDDLVMLRDPKLHDHPPGSLAAMAEQIRDANYRLFAERGRLHLVSAGLHLSGRDPFELFDQLLQRPQSENVDATHAFYLGYELAKANLALQLGKQYEQDCALRWGMLSQEEDLHRLRHGPVNRNR